MQAGDSLTAAPALLPEHGDVTVLTAMWPQQPDTLLAALVATARERAQRLTLMVADLPGAFTFLDQAAIRDVEAGRLRLVTLAGATPRSLTGLADYVASSLWDIDRMLGDGTITFDVFVARVDAGATAGDLALGRMVGYTPTALATDAAVGFEVAPRGAVLPGQMTARLDRAAVTISVPRRTLPGNSRPPRRSRGDVTQIARLVATLVPDRATIQLGLGAVPDAVAGALGNKRDLGIHSGVLPASLRRLVAAGVVTGRAKSVDRGAHVATGVLDDLAGWGEDVRLAPVSQTHAPQQLLRHERLWTINSAFEVDLAAQVNAEWIGGARVASAGGQSDFLRAGHLSSDGASVIALPSRTRDGGPRIVSRLAHPHVSSTGTEVDYVVTEHGIADLRGVTAGERASRLAAIAHPDDREALLASLGQAQPQVMISSVSAGATASMRCT